MTNELNFFIYAITVSAAALFASSRSKEHLIALVVLQAILVNLFVTKQITLFGLAATASDALAIGITFCLNLLQEYYGRESAQQALRISFLGMLFYIVLSILHLTYIPHLSDTAHAHFVALLSPMPRIILASLVVYYIVQYLDIRLFGYLKSRFTDRQLTARSAFSIATTQLLDTILFSFLGLYGIISNIGQIIVVSYTIKLAVIAITAPFMALSRYIRHKNI